MPLEDRLDLARLAKLSPPALWVHVSSLAYCLERKTRGFVPLWTAKDLSGQAAYGQFIPVRELVAAGLWQKHGDGFQILPAYHVQTKRTAAEIDAKRAEVLANIQSLPKGEADRKLVYEMAMFLAGEEPDAQEAVQPRAADDQGGSAG